MSDSWNLWEIKPPPICRVKGLFYSKEINNMKSVLFDVLKTLRNIHYLDKEAAILSRVLYRSKRQFHHDKGMQNLVKMYQCLKRYLKLNLNDVVSNFKSSLPGNLPRGTSHAYLPTKQMLKWVLLRLQAFSQIFVRIMEIAKITGPLIYGKLCLGWGMKIGFFIFGITARLLVLSKFLVAKSIEWYNSLYTYLPYFESTVDFLPEHEFPADLKKWIGDVDLSPPIKKTSIDEVFEILNIADDEGDEEDNEVFVIPNYFLKSLLKSKETTNDSEVEELKVEPSDLKPQIEEKAKSISYTPDLGVPVAKRPKKNVGGDTWHPRKEWNHKFRGKNCKNVPRKKF